MCACMCAYVFPSQCIYCLQPRMRACIVLYCLLPVCFSAFFTVYVLQSMGLEELLTRARLMLILSSLYHFLRYWYDVFIFSALSFFCTAGAQYCTGNVWWNDVGPTRLNPKVQTFGKTFQTLFRSSRNRGARNSVFVTYRQGNNIYIYIYIYICVCV